MRPENEIDEAINQAVEQEDEGGTKWPGMSYEQGVSAALRWATGQSDEHPMAE